MFAGISFQVTNHQVVAAAGIELDGCASITTGLITPSDVEELKNGNLTLLSKVENEINWTVDHKPIFKNASILTLDGKLLAVDKRLKTEGFKAGDSFFIDKKAINELISMRHTTYSSIYHYGNADRMTGYSPIFKDHDSTKEIIAVNAIDFDASVIKQRTWDSLFFPFAVGFSVMIIGVVVLFFVVRRMVRPMIRISTQVHQIASGNLALGPLKIHSQDEVGTLANDINLMVQNLRKLIFEVTQTANNVAASSQQLTASAEQSSKAGEQITEIIEDVAQGSEKQLQSVGESSQAMNQISENVQQIANNTEAVTTKAKQAFAKTVVGNNAVQTVAGQMDSIQEAIQFLGNAVLGLETRSNEIDNIIQTITDIASQTNLLALNAAIEAARAGENGRGFAIVANEVRKLAEQSARSASQISELIQFIRKEIDQASRSVVGVTRDVEEGVRMVQLAEDSFTVISSSVEEVSQQIQEVSSSVQHMTRNTDKVAESIDLILNVAGQTAAGMEHVAAASEEQLATVQEISSSAAYLSNMADELQNQIQQFKIV